MNQPQDVEIVLSNDHKYRFHASMLAKSSVLFANMFTEPSAARLSMKARHAGVARRWLLELVKMPSAQHPAGQLDIIVSSLYAAVLPTHTLANIDTPCTRWTDMRGRNLMPMASAPTDGPVAF